MGLLRHAWMSFQQLSDPQSADEGQWTAPGKAVRLPVRWGAEVVAAHLLMHVVSLLAQALYASFS